MSSNQFEILIQTSLAEWLTASASSEHSGPYAIIYYPHGKKWHPTISLLDNVMCLFWSIVIGDFY